MDQEPKFIFGNGYFVFFGLVDQNDLHHNSACHIILSANHIVSVFDKDGNNYAGQVVLVKPLVKHKIQCEGPMSLIFLSPEHAWRLNPVDGTSKDSISVCGGDELPLKSNSSREEILKILDNIVSAPITKLDPRLICAIEDISSNLQNASILETAKRCNLSRSRLRTLAREQIGMPLSTWLMWRKIVESNKALSKGASLSEAALVGGFSDQAHFTRTMKRMFGVTPTRALRVYT